MGLWAEERAVLDLLAEAWNKFQALPVQHPMHRHEFALSLHQLQRLIMSRPTAREMGLVAEKVGGTTWGSVISTEAKLLNIQQIYGIPMDDVPQAIRDGRIRPVLVEDLPADWETQMLDFTGMGGAKGTVDERPWRVLHK